MRWCTRTDEGAVAAEAALLYGGVAALAMPFLVLLGVQVKDSYDGVCRSGSDASCQVRADPTVSAPPPLTPERATELVEAEVARRIHDDFPTAGEATADCEELRDAVPAQHSTIDCTVEFAGTGEELTVLVTWVDDSGTYTVEVVPA